MAEYMIQGDTLSAIANAIRGKTGGSDPISPEQMATEISNIASGGGGLPEGISAIASGILAPTSNVTADFSIEHNLGKIPEFAILMILEDAATTALKGTQLFQLLSHKPFNSNGTMNTTRGIIVYQNTSGSAANSIVAIMDSSFANTTTVKFRALSNQPLKAGYRYLWLCGVVS